MAKHQHDAERLKTIVRSFDNVTVTVLADLVADEFVFGRSPASRARRRCSF